MRTRELAVSLPRPQLLTTILAGFVAAWLGILADAFLEHRWILDAHRHPVVVDFLEVWVAGMLALNGSPAAPYDWHAHHAAQVAAIHHGFDGFLGWHYPPLFLFVAVSLALLPYAWAFLGWVIATLASYLLIVWRIAGRWEGLLFAAAWPPVLANATAGQNGYLSAALMGGTLLMLRRQPILAGVLAGFLTYKPQLGILIPVALLFGGHWRVFVSAVVTAAVAWGASLLAFGDAPLRAFFRFLPATEAAILGRGTADWSKLQTAYGAARVLGVSDKTAWLIQGAVVFVCCCGIAWLWRRSSRASFGVKAAALCTASLAATPYLFFYDLPVLVVPVAFLFCDAPFDAVEWGAVAVLNLIAVSFIWISFPMGFFAILLTLGLVLRRMHLEIPGRAQVVATAHVIWKRDGADYAAASLPVKR